MQFDNIYGTFNDVSLESLEQQARVISLEGLSGGAFTVGSPQRVKAFFKNAGAFFGKLQFVALAVTKLVPQDMNGIVARQGFVDASNKTIIVPEGFIGQWLPYSAELNAAMVKATKMEYMVRSFNETLGRIIHDPSLLGAFSGIGHTGPTTLGLTEAMVTLGKTYFDPRSNHIHRALGAVIDRAADIGQVHANVNDAVLLDKTHPAKKSLDAVSRTMTLADTLMDAIQARTADKSISNQETVDVALQELVELTLNIAKEMESYGTLLYRLRQFSEALKDSVKELKK